MAKIDLKKVHKSLYSPGKAQVSEVVVPAFRYLMVDGKGDPNSEPAYREAVEALFAVSYTTRFAVKRGPTAIDYAVMPLEGLWWADDMRAFTADDKSAWHWTMMMLQPDFVDEAVILESLATVRDKKGLPGVDRLRLEIFEEGHCAQIMHIGPFSEEGPSIDKVHAHIAASGSLRGKHHEIYLSDIRRANPANWKTVIRQPMQASAG